MSISVANICKAYQGQPALHNVSLSLEEGSFATLLGATGAGKTCLLRIMAGIERPDSGQVFYDGQDVTNVPVRKRNVAMVYQEFVNYPSLTIYENIASPLRVAKTASKTEIDRRVRENAELLGLTQVLNHYPEEVSGGQKQRTAIARALAKDTRFIFLDEPLANLDYKLREELRGELKSILRKKGGVVVYATPEPVDALSMSTHVGYLEQGILFQFGELYQVYRHPEYMQVGAYFSYPTMNIMQAGKEKCGEQTFLRISDEINIDVTRFQDQLPDSTYYVGIRAYNLHTREVSSGLIPFQARVKLSEELGSDTELHLRHQDMPLVVLMQEVVRYPVGSTIQVFLDPTRLFLFNTETKTLVLKTFTE